MTYAPRAKREDSIQTQSRSSLHKVFGLQNLESKTKTCTRSDPPFPQPTSPVPHKSPSTSNAPTISYPYITSKSIKHRIHANPSHIYQAAGGVFGVVAGVAFDWEMLVRALLFRSVARKFFSFSCLLWSSSLRAH